MDMPLQPLPGLTGAPSAPRRLAVIAQIAGMSGALIFMIGISLDYFGGRPGMGTLQWACVGVGLAAVALATHLRHVRAGQLTDALRFAAIMGQMALLYLVVRVYELENVAFNEFLFGVIATGFVAQHFAPVSLRLPFFIALSIGAMLAILGPVNGLILLALAATFIGICHLPVALSARVTLILAVAAALAAVRAGWLQLDRVESVLPLLGSILMFRLVIYLYDLKNGALPKGWGLRLSYFFMLPNFAFPFYPVVDLSAWNRSYREAPTLDVYQRGVTWIVIGLSHLLLYRFVNYRLAFDPTEVAGFAGFLWYCITNFGLYLKISGLFHLILGCLFLYGFALPETHSRYYLSFSFIEFWRRINIYWKDFMQKMVFNPVFTWCKRRGIAHLRSVVLAVIAVFVLTWMLHAYQWFWLRGTLLFSMPDILFWTFLGILLVIQTVKEARPASKPAGGLIGPGALRVVRTVATMLTIVILWSMWSSSTMTEWGHLLGRAGLTFLVPGQAVTPGGLLQSVLFVTFLFAITAIALGYSFGLARSGPARPQAATRRRADMPFATSAAVGIAFGVVLIAMQQYPVYRLLPQKAQVVLVDMGTAHLSSRDQARLERGYYENLTDTNIINSELWDMRAPEGVGDFTLENTPAVRFVKDYRDYVLNPNVVISFKGAVLSTNSLGLRDREYTLGKPAGARRVALIGDSRALGYGVADDETFENLVEDQLNALEGPKVEILNFGVSGYGAFQKNLVLDRVIDEFDADVILYLSHNSELELRRIFANFLARGVMPGEYIRERIEATGVTSDMDPLTILEKVRPATEDLVRLAYQRFGKEARAAGLLPVWVYLPSTRPYLEPLPEQLTLKRMAEEAGFLVIDLYDMYNDYTGDPSNLWIYSWDDHPNAMANRMIADRLMAELLANPEIAARLGR